MGLQLSLNPLQGQAAPQRRFLVLYLPFWATDYLKRADPGLKETKLALYERIKGGLRLAALDPQLSREGGLRIGQNLADARAICPDMVMQEIDRPLLQHGFESFADWHSNTSPLVSVMSDIAGFGDLVLDITGVSHLFGGEAAMLRQVLMRLNTLGYTVAGAIAPTIGAAWAISHFAPSQVVSEDALETMLDGLPVAALRLSESQHATLVQMGLVRIGQVRQRPRKQLQARFGAQFLIRIDQAFGAIEERMAPRLPQVDHYAERRLAEPVSLMDDVLLITQDLAVTLGYQLEKTGLGAQTFHLFLYRVDHKVMTLSLNAARLTRQPGHIADLFRHRAQRLAGEYDAGFGIDMVRLAASSVEALDAVQTGAFSVESGLEDIDRLNDRLSSRLGMQAISRSQAIASWLPERAERFVPAQEKKAGVAALPDLKRPLRLLPTPERVKILAEVPDGLPASMVWRGESYRLIKGEGPERLGAEWWRKDMRLELVEPPIPQEPKPGEDPEELPYVPKLERFKPDDGTRDYYAVEDQDGCRFWVFRQGFYTAEAPPNWYLHGIFA